MVKEKKVAKVERRMKLQGRQVERLNALNQRQRVLNDQQAKIAIEQVKVKGGIDALLDLHVEDGEVAISYDFSRCELLLEKEVEPEKVEAEKK